MTDGHQINGYFQAADISRGALQVSNKLQKSGFSAYIVGGAVRDLLLGGNPKDFDIATDATPEQVKSCFRNARIVGRRFRIVQVRAGREIIEVTTFRGNHEPSDSDGHAKTAKSGRLLRDNVYGTLKEDARRRDLTINALYYDCRSGALIDELDGTRDIEARLIRIIGTPEHRYKEDPVRMLRVIRFAAKLQFDLESKTESAIGKTSSLLSEIPPARLFDEWLKLFMHGHSSSIFQLLEHHQLLQPLMGDGVITPAVGPCSKSLRQLALKNTDRRVSEGRPVTPAFLLGALFWPAVEDRASQMKLKGESPIQAIHSASQQILMEACQRIAIPKRFSLSMRDIWDLQLRLQRMQTKKAPDLLAHRWFRAAYDLLILREQTSDLRSDCIEFWTKQQQKYPDLVGSASSHRNKHGTRRFKGSRRKVTE